MKRIDANRNLVAHLFNLIEQNPDLRFSQILASYGFVREERPGKPEYFIGWQNEFYTESEKVLKRVERRLEKK